MYKLIYKLICKPLIYKWVETRFKKQFDRALLKHIL